MRPNGLARIQRGAIFTWLAAAVFIVLVVLAGYTWLIMTWSYSTGERAGWVQKLSNKGWVCKTWEGELSMVAMPGALPEKFLFSVQSDMVAEQINRNMGKRVSLHYEQKVGIPTSCFGETRYFVTHITIVDQTLVAPSVPEAGAPDPGVKTKQQ